jgi:hypothetical protein
MYLRDIRPEKIYRFASFQSGNGVPLPFFELR